MTETSCFHCDERVPDGLDLSIRYNGEQQPVCCPGCQAVAELIIAGGQGDYYIYRDGPAARPDLPAAAANQWEAFDDATQVQADGLSSVNIWVEGIHCGACGWLIETCLSALPGVYCVSVDVQTAMAHLKWQPQQIAFSELLDQLSALGYRPHPADDESLGQQLDQERSTYLKQMAVAGLGMMQVSMYAVGTYMGADNGMDPAIRRLLYLVSMLVAAPVVFYAGASFLSGAISAIKARKLSMDVPVALALLLAFGASTVNFFRGEGPMFFESATMFVFLLLSARFVAMGVRHRAIDARRALLPMLPDTALLVTEDGERPIPRNRLQPGDTIRIRPGDSVAADGIIASGHSTLNEALLTGESRPRSRSAGDTVLAGSDNLDGSIEVQITAVGDDCALAHAAALLDQARQAKPAQVLLANRISGWVVGSLLVLATGVFFWWLPQGFEAAFSTTLAVLVVTCPCALSLAIPAALSAATTRLAKEGLLVGRLEVLEVLPDVNCALLDKTGTLTAGQPQIQRAGINPDHRQPVTRHQLLSVIAALEHHCSHPLAGAFSAVAWQQPADNVQVLPGRGLTGTVGGRQLTVGSPGFAGPAPDADASLVLADGDGVLGWVVLEDQWREDAAQTLEQLAELGITSVIASGDSNKRTQAAARQLGIERAAGELLPAQKLALLGELQTRDRCTVLAVGDGVNDTGLLGGADVSVAMADGADLARSSADVVLTGAHLQPLLTLHGVACQTRRIVRQNLIWAVAYNLLAVPFAMAGLIGPGLAALGMSISSLVVILNAGRLTRFVPDLKHGNADLGMGPADKTILDVPA